MEFNTTEEIIQDIAAGKMVILLDDEDRENEGDLVFAAELVDDKKINFILLGFAVILLPAIFIFN